MADKKKNDLPPSFEIYSKHPQYSGIHPSKVRFQDGVGRTTNCKQALHCAEAGLKVFDVSTEDGADAAKEFADARAQAFAEKTTK